MKELPSPQPESLSEKKLELIFQRTLTQWIEKYGRELLYVSSLQTVESPFRAILFSRYLTEQLRTRLLLTTSNIPEDVVCELLQSPLATPLVLRALVCSQDYLPLHVHNKLLEHNHFSEDILQLLLLERDLTEDILLHILQIRTTYSAPILHIIARYHPLTKKIIDALEKQTCFQSDIYKLICENGEVEKDLRTYCKKHLQSS